MGAQVNPQQHPSLRYLEVGQVDSWMVPLADCQTAKLSLDLSRICGVPALVGVFLGQTPEEGEKTDREVERQECRAALQILSSQLGAPTHGFSQLEFPHPRLSLSHTGSIRAACVLGAGDCRVAGVGVDVELPRDFSPRISRFFLTDPEMQVLGESDRDSTLRLWTVKEAIFKADPANDQRVLRHYQVDQVHARSGLAALAGVDAPGSLRFWYSSEPFQGGWLTVAASFSGSICQREGTWLQ